MPSGAGWTVRVEKNGTIPSPCKYTWTLYEEGDERAMWYGAFRWSCLLGAKFRRRSIERRRRLPTRGWTVQL